jgi:hypothetical protein
MDREVNQIYGKTNEKIDASIDKNLLSGIISGIFTPDKPNL